MGKLTIFIGVPCSGKTTHRNRAYQHAMAVSRDDIRQSVINSFKVEGINLAYADLFTTPSDSKTEHVRLGKVVHGEFEVVREANKRITKHFDIAIKYAKMRLIKGGDVVVDMLNTTEAERLDTLTRLSADSLNDVLIEAIVFKSEGRMSKIKVLNERRSKEGKSIPFFVIEKYSNQLEMPSIREGFDEIRLIDALA